MTRTFSTTPSAESASTPPNQEGKFACEAPEETFALGERLGETLTGGEAILLSGGLGAGKTLFTKGIMNAVGFDADEVTSPSFTLVNLYRTATFNVYHIDLWRLDSGADIAFSVGLDEILEDENAVVIVEWGDRLRDFPLSSKVIRVNIDGDGDDPRTINIEIM